MAFTESSHTKAQKDERNATFPHQDVIFDSVMCFGTFDIFHPGHRHYLSESHKYAKKLIVVIARDHRVFAGKGKDPVHDEVTRLQTVEQHFPLATVILGDESDIFAPIRTYRPDILAFGYDQRVPEEKIHELFPTIKIVRIGGYETDKWKSSLLRSEQSKAKNTV